MRTSLTSAFCGAIALAIAGCASDGATGPIRRDDPSLTRPGVQSVQLAGGWTGGCRTGDTLIPVGPSDPYDANRDMSVCSTGTEYYDNRIPNEPNGGGWIGGCRAGDTMIFTGPSTFEDVDRNGDYAVCSTGTRYYDNKLEGGNGGGGGGWEGGCRVGDTLVFVAFPNQYDENGDLAICSGSRGYYDNRI